MKTAPNYKEVDCCIICVNSFQQTGRFGEVYYECYKFDDIEPNGICADFRRK